ncbi:fumarylacetoacetate hydrolase family protein [uncultured Bdellovibrio sp.]|uniref:fumarylacetoacetate hydrolase family protein n=1 Tax=Bdellovibrio sp. HCB-162 TaxID=3394234 RepID=UPI0025E20C74|nr:fumarylacetoacetate hydrolase family protein [uncultured Bdellovibrio sp.]
MKLGSLKSPQSLDGELCVISRDLKTAVKATHISANLREALEHWKEKEASLQKLYTDLNEGKAANAFPVDEKNFHSALPRTWLFADGSAFIYHIKLVRMARKAPLPETLETVPLMYQGECGQFLAPTEDIPQRDFSHGTDFEGEVAVVTDFVPMGVTPEEALKYIRLFVLINDVSLRGLIPEELAQGFGFFQSKPASALSPFAVTADELGEAWKGGRIHLPLEVNYNGQFFGKANAGAMHFHFGQLIAHAAKTRNLAAGSVIGSGTVSNESHDKGSSCLAEKRMIEQIETGSIKTPFMKSGDTVEMQMLNEKGQSIFGKISQKVKAV